jgi:hypothetical protein
MLDSGWHPYAMDSGASQQTVHIVDATEDCGPHETAGAAVPRLPPDHATASAGGVRYDPRYGTVALVALIRKTRSNVFFMCF